MFKKFLLVVAAAVMSFFMTEAKTLRVNNIPGSGAQYTNFKDAQDAASDGDIIIFDGSKTNYGNIVVNKKLTIQGPGYFLQENNASSESINEACFEGITVNAEGTKITGIVVDGFGDGGLILQANNIVVTRCKITIINLKKDFSFSDNAISNCIIHQNYITTRIQSDAYSAHATNLQITNNIIYAYNFLGMDNSTISRNTFIYASYDNMENNVYEYNTGSILVNGYNHDNNIIRENISHTYNSIKNDQQVKDEDAKIAQNSGGFKYGAFSGEDPYVLSGLSSGPRIQDIEMPETVVQGENLKVSVKIAVTQ